MKKDIKAIKVTDVAIAIVPRSDEKTGQDLWDTYLINLRDEVLENVIISSKGYGQLDGREKVTTTLRHFFDSVPPQSAVQVEPIQRELFELANEYWVSFNLGKDMLDKKFVFVAGSITKDFLRKLPVLDKPGVMIV
ncbi:MAG: hypothetical protein AAFY36_08510 [Bacteroidota bacterium]